MTNGRSRLVLGAGALLGVALAFAPATALAYHTEEQRLTDESAYTLRGGDVRVGLWKLQDGIVDAVLAGTYTFPWLLRAPNLHAKWRFWQRDPLAFSLFSGILQFDTERLRQLDDEPGEATITVVPLELGASYRFGEHWTLSFVPVWTAVIVRGRLDDDDLQGVGRGAVTNLQAAATLEWRVTRVTAFLLHGRYLVFQNARGRGNAVLHPDEFTTVEIHAAGSSDALDFRNAGSVTLSSVFSWNTFNLRLGVVAGHYNVPAVNFVVGRALVLPDIDFYWIF